MRPERFLAALHESLWRPARKIPSLWVNQQILLLDAKGESRLA
jgi:hypothetical protein